MASLEQEVSISGPTLGPILPDTELVQYLCTLRKDMQPSSLAAELSTEGETGTNRTERKFVGFATPRRVCPKCDEYIPRNQPDCRCHVSAATEPTFDFFKKAEPVGGGGIREAPSVTDQVAERPLLMPGKDTLDREKETDGKRKRAAEREGLSESKKRSVATTDPDLCIDAHKLVYFDLESTGVWGGSEVVQIAAMTGDDEFSCYILPMSDFENDASQVNGLHCRDDCLYLNGVEVETEDRHQAWTSLLDFLDKYDTPIILVGQAIGNLDMRMTRDELGFMGLEDRFDKIVTGVIDTVKVLRKALPNRESYKLQDIATYLGVVDTKYGAHDARGDVRTTRNIVEHLDLPDQHLKAFYDSFAEKKEKKRLADAKEKNKTSLSPLKNLISSAMIGKIAGPANLSLTDLQAAMRKGGGDEIKRLFTEDCNGKPRVTKNKETLGIVISTLESLESSGLDKLEAVEPN